MSGGVKKGALGLPADSVGERFFNGLLAENPTFVLMLGMCPTLAVTTSATNGLTMGLATTVVLALSNLMISLLRKVIPDTVRIPSFIVVIASFVTLVQLVLQAYLPALNEALGVYIPLIVVNCIIFGRAEAYASKHGAIPAFFDGLGMGIGFTCAITIIGFFREFIGAGTAFGIQILGDGTIVPGPVGSFLSMYQPISIFIMQSGAFFVLAFLIATMNWIKKGKAKKGKDVSKFRDTSDTDTLVETAAPAGEEAPVKEEKAADMKEEASVKEEAPVKEEASEEKPSEEINEPAAEEKEGGEQA